MKTDQTKPLTEIEWTTCWMAIRYAMGRSSAASASLPRELLEAYLDRWSDAQKRTIVRDLRDYLEDDKRWNDSDEGFFGDKNIDHHIWMKFLLTLDKSAHVEITLKNGRKEVAFEYEGFYYELSWWSSCSPFPIRPCDIISFEKLQDHDK